MSSHAPHQHDGPAPILFDDCPRCAEHALSVLWSLDSEHASALWRRMVEVEKRGGRYRSENEATACRKLYEVALFLERQTPIDPWGWPLAPRAPLRPTS
jgi:hypothetical protein